MSMSMNQFNIRSFLQYLKDSTLYCRGPINASDKCGMPTVATDMESAAHSGRIEDNIFSSLLELGKKPGPQLVE